MPTHRASSFPAAAEPQQMVPCHWRKGGPIKLASDRCARRRRAGHGSSYWVFGRNLSAQVASGSWRRQAGEPKWAPSGTEPDRRVRTILALGLGTVTCEYSRVTTPNNALRVVPFSTLRATPTPGTAHMIYVTAGGAAEILGRVTEVEGYQWSVGSQGCRPAVRRSRLVAFADRPRRWLAHQDYWRLVQYARDIEISPRGSPRVLMRDGRRYGRKRI